VNLIKQVAYGLDPVAWLERSLGFAPDPWQGNVLRSIAQRILLCCSRQVGKTITAAALALHLAQFTPGSLALILAPSLRQSGELYRDVSEFYTGSPPAETETKTTLELVNGSRIVCLPGTEKTIRSFSAVDLLVVDEAARTDDALLAAVRPMLAVSGGRLIALSTPFGKRGWWWDAWENGGDAWERIEITADQCPRISAKFLAEEREALGDWWYFQEFFNVFHDPIDAMFTEVEIAGIFTSDIVPLY